MIDFGPISKRALRKGFSKETNFMFRHSCCRPVLRLPFTKRMARLAFRTTLRLDICAAAAILLVLLTATSQAQSTSGVFRCRDQRHIINLSINNSGQVVEGPVCAEIAINALRYGADFGKTVSYAAGANLSGIFPSNFSAGG